MLVCKGHTPAPSPDLTPHFTRAESPSRFTSEHVKIYFVVYVLPKPFLRSTRGSFGPRLKEKGGCGRHRDTLQDSDTQYLADQFTPLPSTALSWLTERRETVNGGGGVDRSYQGERKGNLQISQISRSRVKPLHQMLMLNRTTRQGAGYEQKRGR